MGNPTDVLDDSADAVVEVEVETEVVEVDVGLGRVRRRSLSRYPPIMLMIVSNTVAITTGKKIWRRCWE
ncbi:hypothetical protein Areg01_38230 [Actinoplanes regularis]|nr:hypothetical protein Are01nite_43440 [Actinoplanes regularis]GLW30883.1 hypothetical protein Areg01_38230 [Actinoplanes regularis]